MAKTQHPIPPHLHSVTPYMVIRDAKKALDFYVKAFGAEKLVEMDGPDGKLMHGEIKIGDSIVFVGEECAQMGQLGPESRGGSTMGLMLYVNDVDATFDKAVKAGCTVTMPVDDMFWGDRYGRLADPFGHTWSIATHKEDLTPEEMKKAQAEALKQMALAK